MRLLRVWGVFMVTLVGWLGLSPGTGYAIEDPPLLTVDNVHCVDAVPDPSGDPTPPNPCVLVIYLSHAVEEPVRVFISTRAATATERDFVPIDQREVLVPPGGTKADTPLDIIEDRLCEPDEHFYVLLFGPSTPAGGAVATVTIVDSCGRV